MYVKRYFVGVIFIMFVCLICSWSASAEVDWQVQQTVNLEKKPIDVAVSARGSYLFILTDDGIVHVYDKVGNLKGQIEAGKNVDGITCGPDENLLILKNKKQREVRKIIVEYIKNIDIEGSPYRGNADAPVVIVVFTDYQ